MLPISVGTIILMQGCYGRPYGAMLWPLSKMNSEKSESMLFECVHFSSVCNKKMDDACGMNV